MEVLLLILLALLPSTKSLEDSAVDLFLYHAAQLNPKHLCVFSDDIACETFDNLFRNPQLSSIPRSIISSSNLNNANPVGFKCSLVAIDVSYFRLLDKLLSKFSGGSSWNRNAWYVVITTHEDILKSFTKSVDKYGILNSVLLVKFSSRSSFVGYNYYTKSKVKLLNVQDALGYMISDKTRNVQGFSLKVRLSPHYFYLPYQVTGEMGTYGKLIDIYSRRINASIEWISIPHEVPVSSGLKSHSVHISPLHIAVGNILTEVDTVPMPEIDGFCFVVTEAPISSYFHHLMVPFSIAVWVIIFVTVISVICANHIFRQMLPRDLLAGYFLGLAIQHYRMQKVERFFFIGITWLFFICGEAYLAIIISFMSNIKHEQRLKNLDDYRKSEYHFCKSGYIVEEQNGANSGKVKRTGDQDIKCVFMSVCSEALLFVDTIKSARNLNMYILSERFNWTFLATMFSPTQPFAEAFRKTLRDVFEFGFWDWWVKQETTARQLRQVGQLGILAFEDLVSLWWLFAYGFTLASIVFAFENIVHRCQKKRHKMV